MLVRAHAPAGLERCGRQPLPEEEAGADDDAAEADVQLAQPCFARPSAWGALPRRLAALAGVLAGAAAVVAWGQAGGVRAAAPMAPEWREGAVGLLQAECTEVNGNCLASRCCSDPALTCFEKDETWAACIEGCEPGIHEDWDPPGKQTSWSCKPLTSGPDAGGANEDDDDAGDEEGAAVEAQAGAPASCEDLLEDWQDAAGRSCEDYEQGRLCTSSGDFGPGWNGSGGIPVPSVAVLGRGLSAAEACCACGGGSASGSTWSLAHRDWRCREDASRLADKQAPDMLRLPDCEKFCFSYTYMEFWTSEHPGVCQCHSECSAGGQDTPPGHHNLVYRRAASA